tara:strand:- start:585 stop:1127 length:543 start_codon:yes stop_codon:yes gene_type:complete
LVTKCFYAKADKKHLKHYQEIKKNALLGFKKPKLILKVIDYFKPTNTLEIGNSLGLVASVIKISQPNATDTTIANTSETADFAENLFSKNQVKATNNKPFDLVFFNSTGKATLSCFESCLSSVHNETFFIFKDLYSSKEMRTTWAKIKQHPEVTVTVDVFYYGFVFIRKEQQKEHFKIRT